MSYKKLGEYIRKVDNKNKDMKILNLQGLSMSKEFRKSTSNIVGTDLSKYKIVKQGQFCCDFMSVIRVHKLPVVLNNLGEDVIISPAYVVFEVIDESLLLPEYLMLWFRRSEFDRYADFRCDSSIRGGFQWEELCEVELPIPSIEKQREIVAQYQAVANKIKVNEQICEKLEAAAQALYKHWFVDFEFPNEEGKPYKSSGGKMVWNEELEKEIPEGWEVVKVKDFCEEMKNGATPSRDIAEYWNSRDIPWLKTGEISNNVVFDAEEYISKEGFANSSTKLIPADSVLMAMYGATAGQLAYLKREVTTNQACCAMISSDKNKMAFLYYALLNQQSHIVTLANGGAQANLSKQIIEELSLILPQNIESIELEKFSYLIEEKAIKTLENQKLTQLQSLLLSRLARLEG